MIAPSALKHLRERLRMDEGCRTFPYKDTVGQVTIGVGHNLSSKGLRPEEIELILTNDINESVGECETQFPWFLGLTEPRQIVIVSMLFNMGLGHLLGFTDMLRAMERGDYQAAAKAMRDSRWYTQVKARGQRLALQMETGELVT